MDLRLAPIALFALAFACTRPSTCPRGSGADPDECGRVGCPRFASGDARHGCTCNDGSEPLAGACVSASTAKAFCGAAARHASDGCVLQTCAPDEPLDVARGACVPAIELRAAAALDHIRLAKSETLSCKGERPLLVDDGHPFCVPDDALCPRGTRWSAPAGARADAGARGGLCERPPRCFAGEVLDRETSQCVRVVQAGGGQRPRVDVARWARLVLGPDGGLGTPLLCAPLAQHPAAFALQAPASARARIAIEIHFPDADVTQLYASTRATLDDAAGSPLPPNAAGVVEEAVAPLVEALRALGGDAEAGVVRATVRCEVRTLDRPQLVPRALTGDAGADLDEE